jgi:hypothetical protein
MDSISRATTLHAGPQSQHSKEDRFDLYEERPDPPEPPKAIQNLRYAKYWLKAQFKGGKRDYNPYSGF